MENHDRQRPNWIRHLERERETILDCGVLVPILVTIYTASFGQLLRQLAVQYHYDLLQTTVHRPLSRKRHCKTVRQTTRLVVLCNASQSRLRYPFRNLRVRNEIFISPIYTRKIWAGPDNCRPAQILFCIYTAFRVGRPTSLR